MEDDPSVAKALRVLLKVNKHQVEVVGDGEAALASYKKSNHDLVITDFLLPGIDGLELARLIKARAPQQPVVLATGYMEQVSNREKARLKHIDVLLPKPFSAEQLHKALRAVFPEG